MKRFFLLALVGSVIVSCAMNEKDEGGIYVGRNNVKVEDGVLTPEVMLSMGRVGSGLLSPDGSTVLYTVSYASIKDNTICRNLFACDTDGSNSRQLTSYAKGLSCPSWSNDGKTIYFLQGGQLWKAPYKGNCLGKKKKISSIPNGISEYKISPDGKLILFVTTIPGPVKSPSDFNPALDKAKAYVAEDLMYRHWDHWTTSTPRTYYASLTDNITLDMAYDILYGQSAGVELPTEPFGGIEQIEWNPDSRHIAYSCRKLSGIKYAFSTNADIYVYDTFTGAEMQVSSGGGYDIDPKWSPDGKYLAWISMERDGYEADRQRIMVARAKLDTPEQNTAFGVAFTNPVEITEGFEYDAAGIFWVPGSQDIIFAATTDAIGALYRVNMERGGASIKCISSPRWPFSLSTPFAYEKCNEGYRLLTSYNSMDFPTELVRVTIYDEAEPFAAPITQENKHILSQLSEIKTKSIILKTEQGEDLHCWVLYPPDFDADKKYNAIEMFNGGPQSCLDQSWSYRWNFRLMCQQGYIVILPNRHGNSGFGQAWKEQISGDYQGLNMQDYMLAAKWFKSQSYAGKIAGVGASYGGFSVYNMMGLHGDLFDCFISHAGIFNEKQMWYTTEEAWFGNWDNGGLTQYQYATGQIGPKGDGITFGGMQQAAAPYADVEKSRYHYANDPESRVTKWHTPILCMHGMMDYRIPYEQGMAAFNAAKMMGVPAKLVIFPEENHWILQPQNALFWQQCFFDWLHQWMD